MDLSKAFDIVNHQLLLDKPEYYGIKSIANDWFKSYLENRNSLFLWVVLNQICCTFSCDVPQGSVLGPILFLLYINDFDNCSEILDFHLFADDSNIFHTDKRLSGLESCINSQLTSVNTWLCANKLSLNINKSNFIIFHPIQKQIDDSFQLTLNGQLLKREYKTKYLGIVIDCHLNWKDHVSHISKKIKRNIRAISKIRHFVNLDILKSLYYALVYPYLTYCLIAWGNNLPFFIESNFYITEKVCSVNYIFWL